MTLTSIMLLYPNPEKCRCPYIRECFIIFNFGQLYKREAYENHKSNQLIKSMSIPTSNDALIYSKYMRQVPWVITSNKKERTKNKKCKDVECLKIYKERKLRKGRLNHNWGPVKITMSDYNFNINWI